MVSQELMVKQCKKLVTFYGVLVTYNNFIFLPNTDWPHRQNERRCIIIGLIFFKTWSQKPIVGHVWSQNVKTSIRTEMVEARLWSNEALVGQTDTKHFNLPSPFLMAGGSLTSPCSCHEGLRNHSYEILLHDCRIM